MVTFAAGAGAGSGVRLAPGWQRERLESVLYLGVGDGSLLLLLLLARGGAQRAFPHVVVETLVRQQQLS